MRGKSKLFITLTLLGFLFGAFFLAVSRLNFFTIKTIEITGSKRVSQKEILKRSGFRPGINMFSFLESSATQEIVKNPWITSAHIKRELPGKVIIEIKEDEPFCLVLMEDGELYYMSKSGKKLGDANFQEGLDFPVLTGEVIISTDLVLGALDILKLSIASPTLNWKEISEINLNSIYGLTVLTTDGRRIDFGENNIVEKWYKVEKIITHARGINLTEKYINISSGKIGVVDFKL
ncbi:MAG TPA: FtsQ-type POTRA domain-containing protein [Thermodesulfobacteriota bacterium]